MSQNPPPPPLPWNVRSWLLFYAFGAGVLYAGSFLVVFPRQHVIAAATSVVIALAIAGGLLLMALSASHKATSGAVGPLSWLDALLLALRVGLWVTLLGVVVNLAVRRGMGWLYPHLVPAHTAVAVAANLAMLLVFLKRSRARDLSPGRALLLWLGADVVFLIAAWALWPTAG